MWYNKRKRDLQYTLLLLIHSSPFPKITEFLSFTIHFATINTEVLIRSSLLFVNLQYTLLLLIQTAKSKILSNIENLQYTLLLLIPHLNYHVVHFPSLFTIHFATINTGSKNAHVLKYESFTIHFATINTKPIFIFVKLLLIFTIHFATINTNLKLKI